MMITATESYILGKKLGLNKKDIDQVLNDLQSGNEKTSFELGPPFYGGGRYGTISIKVFIKPDP